MFNVSETWNKFVSFFCLFVSAIFNKEAYSKDLKDGIFGI